MHGTHEVVLARYTQHDPDEPGYFAFFGTEFTAWPEDTEIVELAYARGV